MTISPIRIILTSSTWIDGVRSVDWVIRLSAKLLAILVSHSATISSSAELDHEQRRQPQSAEHDRDRVERVDRRIKLADDAQRRHQPRRQRHQADDEGVANDRGHEPDDQPGERELGGDHRADSCGSARSNGTSTTRASDHQHREHRGRKRCRPARARTAAAARPAHRERGHVDPRANRRAGGKGDPGGGQDQAELQIEPGRGDLGADRTRGGVQEIDDVVQIHRQNLISRQIGVRQALIRMSGRFP